MRRRAAFALLALPLAARAQPSPVGVAWRAERLGAAEIWGDRRPELNLDANGQAHGTGGCNRFSGRYTMEGARLAFAPLAASRMACAGPLGEMEDQFLRALGEVRGWRMERNQLLLTNEAGAALLRFSRAA
jgi:heat shock protein HslJ